MKIVKIEWAGTFLSGQLEFVAPYEFAAIDICYALAKAKTDCAIDISINDKSVFATHSKTICKENLRQIVINAFKEGE